MQYLTSTEEQRLFTKTEEREYRVRDLLDTFRLLGLKKGETVCVHSQLYSLGKPLLSKKEYLNVLVNALKQVVGENGTVIMPAFSYSFCEKEVFDVQNSKSKVGLLTEFFRNSEGIARTVHPIFSFSVWGKRKEEFLDIGKDAFSMHSVYGKMIEKNDKMLLLGAQKGYTIYYLAEERVGVNHRFFKDFSGVVRDGQEEYDLTVPYYVRHLDKRSEESPQKVSAYLSERGIQKNLPFGWGSVSAFSCREMFEGIVEKLEQDETYFLKEN